MLKNDNGLKQLSSLIADGESVTDVKERATKNNTAKSTVQSTIAKSNGKSLKQLFLDYYIFIAVPIVIFLLIIVFEIMRRKQKRMNRSSHSNTQFSRRNKR